MACSAKQLATDSKGGGSVLGGSSMEYNQEAGPTKYLVGTEQGVIMQVKATVIYRLNNRQLPVNM
jgi:hypothetical protein